MQLLNAVLLLASAAAGLAQTHPNRATSGCGKSQFLPGVTQYRFGLKSSNKDRSYGYHLPSSYDKNKKYPIVIGFHGSSSVGLFFELDTKLSESRFSGEKIMVYPNGIDGSWAGPTYHNGTTVDEDIQFVADIIADTKASFCVDDAKVYGVGYVNSPFLICFSDYLFVLEMFPADRERMSNGGGFIGTLACSPIGSRLFTALAAGSGAFYTDVNGPDNGCSPAKIPLPILEIHGGSDKTVKYSGGQGDGGPQPPISSWYELGVADFSEL